MTDVVDRKKSGYRALFRIVIGTLAAFGGAATAVLKGVEYVNRLRGGAPLLEVLPSVVLLAATVAYGFAWYFSANTEYGLFEKHLDKFAPDRPMEAVIASVAVPGVLSVLALVTDDIFLYSCVFLAYTLVNAVVRSAMTREARQTFERAEGHVDAFILSEFRVLYLERPFQPMNWILIVGGVAALLCSVFASQLGIMLPGADGRLIAYCCLLFSLVVTEALVWSWRARFYRNAA